MRFDGLSMRLRRWSSETSPAASPLARRNAIAAYLSILVVTLPHCVVAQSAAARIDVTEPSGVARPDWPFGVGIPLPQGYARDTGEIRLSDQGKPVLIQARTLSRWPDSSLRWLFVDGVISLKPREQRVLILSKQAAAATAASGVSVQELGDRIEIDTGAAQFSIPKRGVAFLQNLRRSGEARGFGPLTSDLSIDGKIYAAEIPESVKIVERGPVRVRVELQGKYGAGMTYLVRIDAFAHQPLVHVLHTFEQHSNQPAIHLQHLSMRLAVSFDNPTYGVGRVGKAAATGKLGTGALSVLQLDNHSLQIGAQREDSKASGWFEMRDAQRAVALSARYFWQEYPQSVQFQHDALTYHLWSPDAPAALVGMGAAKTHEFLVYVGRRDGVEARLLDAGSVPLIGHIDAQWIRRTATLRNAIADTAGATAFLADLKAGYERYQRHADREPWDDRGTPECNAAAPGASGERRRLGFYGMFNWGDWNFPGYHDDTKGCDAWGNLEYDISHVLALAYLASGESRYADGMVAAARHFMDVDTIHYQADHPQWVGMNHPKNPLHFSFALGGVDLGHTWTEGLLSYYLITGDERGLATARGIADFLVRRLRSNPLRGNPRQWGWPQIALVAAYEVSGDADYKQAAIEYARRGMAQHAPDSFKDWKIGILAEALAYTHSISGEAAISSWLTRYAAAVAAYPGHPDPRFMPAVAYVGRVMHKPEFSRLAEQTVTSLSFGNWGKPFTIAGRLGFSLLSQEGDSGRRR